MKKILFTLLLAAAGFSVQAQCIPDPTLTSSGMKPKDLPNAKAGVAYNESITFRFPKDTTYMNFTVPIDSARIDSVNGFPAGFTWEVNKASRTYKPEENGCVKISGTANNNQVGDYTLKVYVTAYFKVGGQPLQYPFSNTVALKVTQGTAIHKALTAKPATPVFELKANYPNPFTASTTIEYSVPASQPVLFKVYDLLGNVVQERQVQATRGDNNISFERGNLKSGLYFYSIQAGGKTFTRRMMIGG